MSPSLAKVPAHLRQFVVEQDYAAYNAVDQAVWRFVLLQVSSRLAETAHPAYRGGLAAAGIVVDRIPRIAEMDDKLSRFGWGAVCVDGFIPPRAFQEFQAHALLPIAAAIRTRGHLVYTPAPDILHEAAGHAPILPEPEFAAYVKRIGALGRRAFARPEEKRVYQAIYELSEVKENPALSPKEVARAEVGLARALEGVHEPSEAARLSRLYWWTAEYGLLGSPENYELYGAGLLSSLWESHSCHAASVRKLPLDIGCMDVDYDITKPQPQLFVAASFASLHDILDQAERSLATTIGGELALRRALESEELASIRFSSGLWAMGVLRKLGPKLSEPAWLSFDDDVTFAWEGKLEREHQGESALAGHPLVIGRLEGGVALDELLPSDLSRYRDAGSGRHRFAFTTGAFVEGRLEQSRLRSNGRISLLELSNARVCLPGHAAFDVAAYPLWAAGVPLTAEAGAIDPGYHAQTEFAKKRVPSRRRLSEEEQTLLRLYEQAERAHRGGLPSLGQELFRIYGRLSSYPAEWLLRWNLLESLLKAQVEPDFCRKLEADLRALEVEFDEREPIASGLRYLEQSGRPVSKPSPARS